MSDSKNLQDQRSSKPREFWVGKYAYMKGSYLATVNDPMQGENWPIEGPWHVIEKSAYDELEAKCEAHRLKYNVSIKELRDAADKLAGFVGWYATTKHGPQCEKGPQYEHLLCTCGVDIAKDLIKEYRCTEGADRDEGPGGEE